MATYTVVSGDTLSAIASNLGVDDWRDLYVNGELAANVDPRRLQIGAVVTTAPEEAESGTAEASQDPGNVPITTGPGDDVEFSGQVTGSDGEIIRSGILGGGQLVRLPQGEGQQDLWFQLYRIPNTNTYTYFLYDSTDSDGDGWPDQVTQVNGPNPAYGNTTQTWWDRKNSDGTLFVGGGAEDMVGIAGTFDQWWTKAVDDALRGAGVSDPGLRGRILNDPRGEMASLLVLAAQPGSTITADEITAEMRNSEIWQEIYPGINYFYDLGVDEPEIAWRQYESQVADGLRRIGVQPGADGSYRDSIGDLLGSGVSANEFNDFLPTLETIQANPAMKATFDEWAMRELGRDLDFNEYIDVLEGTSDPELNQVIEAATLAWAAESAGVAASVDEIRRIAENTDLTPDQALKAFTTQERTLLGIGNQDLQPFGISRGDFLDVAAGVAPRSGLSNAEVDRIAQQLIGERAQADDPSARFFAGFNQRQQIQRQGLGSTRQVGG